MKLEKLDKWLLGVVCLTIIADVAVNYITSYGHLYNEGLHYGEYGVDARLNPIGIDLTLTTLAVTNVFAARFKRSHWLLRFALAFAVGGTVAANAAYGMRWGITGGLLATWSPVTLFITVETGLLAFRIVADLAADKIREEAAKAVTEAPSVLPVPRKEIPAESPSSLREMVQSWREDPHPVTEPIPVGGIDVMKALKDTGQLPVLK